MSGRLRQKLVGLRSYSAGEVLLAPVAIMLLGLARAAIIVIPFRWYVRALGHVSSIDAASISISPRQDSIARSVGRSVRASAAITPWQSVCLPQAIAASLLLKACRIPHVSHFGLAPGETSPEAAPMQAHAWLIAGERIITGAPVLPEYTVVATFSSPLPV